MNEKITKDFLVGVKSLSEHPHDIICDELISRIENETLFDKFNHFFMENYKVLLKAITHKQVTFLSYLARLHGKEGFPLYKNYSDFIDFLDLADKDAVCRHCTKLINLQFIKHDPRKRHKGEFSLNFDAIKRYVEENKE